MLPELAAAVLVLSALAEWLHARRVRRLAALVFGPKKKPAAWAAAAPLLRVLSIAALAWGLGTLFYVEPKVFHAREVEAKHYRHVILVLDVSPSMKLEDAGVNMKQSRAHRVGELMDSFFKRVPMEQVRLSVIATYTSAKPVVVDTRDVAVVKNILTDLPMSQAFEVGETRIFEGLAMAAKVAHGWQRASTTIILLTDGDTVPSAGMPEMPPSVKDIVCIGVGDARAGKFIAGKQSRQDSATLKQIATRLHGSYHDGNQKQLPSELLAQITSVETESTLEKLGRREYALIAAGIGGTLLALLPLALGLWGTAWRPGRRSVAPSPASEAAVAASR